MIKKIKRFLYKNNKISIGLSPIHRWGVFAIDNINTNEILEEVPFLTLPIKQGESSDLFIDYRFNYPAGSEWKSQVLPLGSGCLYNHSEDANAIWYTDTDNEIYIFKAVRNISKGEEIFVYYGNADYWNDGRKHTKVK